MTILGSKQTNKQKKKQNKQENIHSMHTNLKISSYCRYSGKEHCLEKSSCVFFSPFQHWKKYDIYEKQTKEETDSVVLIESLKRASQ